MRLFSIFLCLLLGLSACRGGTAPRLEDREISVAEPTVTVARIAATSSGSGRLEYALTGTDANLFTLSAEGDLAFKSPPNFERPLDAGKDNVYDVVVSVTNKSVNASANIRVKVTDIIELPNNVRQASIVTNTNSSQIADFEANNGTRFRLSGERNEAGLANAITAVQISNIQSSNETLRGTSAQALTDPNGRIREIFYEQGARARLTYGADGRIASIGIVLADGSEQAVVNVDYSMNSQAGPSSAPLGSQALGQSVRRRSGQMTVSALAPETQCAMFGTPSGRLAAPANVVGTNGTTSVNLSLRECGNPVEGARVFVVRAEAGLAPTYPAADLGGGSYRAFVPISNGIGPAIEEHCSAFIETVNGICSAVSDAGGLDGTIVAGLAANCLRFIEPPAVAICQATIGILATYCEFGAPITDLVADSFCENLRENLDLPSEEFVTYYAIAYLPSGGRAESGHVTVRRSDPIPPLSIESGAILGPAIIAFVQPEDPNPRQGYAVQVGVSCRANADQVTVSVVGTDGYQDSRTCQLINKQGGCVLNVPGGDAGVIDRITIRAGNEIRQLTIVF
jgi:hypothetical protein